MKLLIKFSDEATIKSVNKIKTQLSQIHSWLDKESYGTDIIINDFVAVTNISNLIDEFRKLDPKIEFIAFNDLQKGCIK